jgi:GT2 family glycosyltransferase
VTPPQENVSADPDPGLNEAVAHYRRGRLDEASSDAARGWLFHRSRDGRYDAVIFDLEAGVATDIVALDGTFYCARSEAVDRVGLDCATFDGFHLYDIDFSYRTHLAGFRVGVTHDIVIAHESVGNFNET